MRDFERIDQTALFELCGHNNTVLAIHNEEPIDTIQFRRHVERLASKLCGGATYHINLCEDRYYFLVAFAAAVLNNQINLLPSSRAPKEIERLQSIYSDSDLIEDATVQAICTQATSDRNEDKLNWLISAEQLVAIVFTSGSTGQPKANTKYWGQLVASAQRVASRLEINAKQPHCIVATVPPQHMFGFETTIIFPLVLGVCIHAGRPFYPCDVQQTLAAQTMSPILVTTPLHLRRQMLQEIAMKQEP